MLVNYYKLVIFKTWNIQSKIFKHKPNGLIRPCYIYIYIYIYTHTHICMYNESVPPVMWH